MSNLEREPVEAQAGGRADVAAEPVRDVLEGREVVLGGTRGMPVIRTLPNKVRRMVGAWCFVDHFVGHDRMVVPPHPHTGLQTVTWLVAGRVRHRDSLGSDQVIAPGQLNLMTAGRGIAHAETSPVDPAATGGSLHGVQLWVALPDGDRNTEPAFAHHADLPEGGDGGATVRVLLGDLAGLRSPARAYTPIVGAEIALGARARSQLELVPDFEYAALTLTGEARVDGVSLAPGPMLYLGCGRATLDITADEPARMLLLGGEPFAERIVMWWNFIGRGHDEVAAFREDWAAGRRFGEVRYEGDRLPAPPMPVTTLVPRGRTRD
jgi:redox-sensitive bicupin YhaK (pirin superfamily)